MRTSIDSVETILLVQIRVQHPKYPSTRLAIKVPSLGIHFSPARYHRLMSVLSAIGGSDSVPADSPEIGMTVPWQRSDYSGDARLLVWGVSNNLSKLVSRRSQQLCA